MGFSCPVCGDTLYISSLCQDCCLFRRLVSLYTKEVVIDSCNSIFLLKKSKVEHKTKLEAEKYTNERQSDAR